jgi:hypothetical protein
MGKRLPNDPPETINAGEPQGPRRGAPTRLHLREPADFIGGRASLDVSPDGPYRLEPSEFGVTIFRRHDHMPVAARRCYFKPWCDVKLVEFAVEDDSPAE